MTSHVTPSLYIPFSLLRDVFLCLTILIGIFISVFLRCSALWDLLVSDEGLNCSLGLDRSILLYTVIIL